MRHFKMNEILGLLLLAAYTAIHFLLPSSFWFTVDKFDVLDSIEGDVIEVDYKRTIKREYVADWRVIVRRETEGGYEQVCSSPVHRQDYDPEQVLKKPVTLKWLAFTDSRCYELPAGKYVVTIAWDINPVLPGALLLSRTERVSDRFSVVAP